MIFSKMHLVSCTNTHHGIINLVNYGMIQNTKTWISWEQNITFLWNKEILNLCFRWYILRSYHFVVGVTFKKWKLYYNSFTNSQPATLLNLSYSLIRRKIKKSILGSFFMTLVSGCFCFMLILSTKNGLIQVKTVKLHHTKLMDNMGSSSNQWGKSHLHEPTFCYELQLYGERGWRWVGACKSFVWGWSWGTFEKKILKFGFQNISF